MEKLRYALFELNKNLVFTIFGQDERFMDKGDKGREYKCKNGWKVASQSFPAIDDVTKTIYLRGLDRGGDNNIYRQPYTNSQELIDIHEALADWAKNWDGWNEEKTSIESVDIKINTLE